MVESGDVPKGAGEPPGDKRSGRPEGDLGFYVERVELMHLRPRWIYNEEPLRHGMGFSMQCPAHRDSPADVVCFWFVRPQDGGDPLTIGGERKPDELFDYEGRTFAELTVWQALPFPDEAVRGPHWWGYIAKGYVYSCPRWTGL